MNWILLIEIIYFLFLMLVGLRIIYDTHTNSKTLAYLLLVIFLPVIGIILYFSIGINYRKRKMFSKKLMQDEDYILKVRSDVFRSSQAILQNIPILKWSGLANLILNDTYSPITAGNAAEILVNGEQKFPNVLDTLKSAEHFIHLEYYIYEDDEIGRAIENILVQKVKSGVKVRFIYDDFGSHSVRKRMAENLREAGVEIFPFSKVVFWRLANRLNYRNHRKIIIIDGRIAFVGGINVSDKYINNATKEQTYWRDMHLKIGGPAVHFLQYLFLCDWNFCAKQNLEPTEEFFPLDFSANEDSDKVIQIVGSGPDSDRPSIMLSILKSISSAKEQICIATPYFIPGTSLNDALICAALSGVKVKLLLPGISDSKVVNWAAHSYFEELLEAGVEIYLYQKGFLHAKTLVIDDSIAMIGTANMDQRSYVLNFEVNAVIYNSQSAQEMTAIFNKDLESAIPITLENWKLRSRAKHLGERLARLLSPLL